MLNEGDFKYLEEHLTCAKFILHVQDSLQAENNTYYDIMLPGPVVVLRRILRRKEKFVIQ